MVEQAQPSTGATDDLARSYRGLADRIGAEIGVSDWMVIDRARVRAFASASGENLWLHTDLDRARAAGFADLVVQAHLLLCQLGTWVQAVGPWLPPPAAPRNAGYDRVRFAERVFAGEPVRGRFTLASLTLQTSQNAQVATDVTVERQGSDGAISPVLAARWLIGFRLPDGALAPA